MGHSSCFACVGSPWAAASLRAQPPAPSWRPPQAAMWYPVWSVSPWVAEGQPVPPWSSSWPAEESAAVPIVALPLLFHWPWCQCTELFLLHFSYSSFLQLCNVSYLFLSFQINARASSLLFGTAVSCSRSILELAGTSCFWHVGLNFQGKNARVSTLASYIVV